MRKLLFLLFLIFVLSGCATYKFQKATTSGAAGYLACYDGKPISEYTVGKEKTFPDLTLAKERFKRRRSTVEYYYKQMNQIDSRLKTFLWEPSAMVVDFLGGVLRWPFIAVADYKYNHNPKYKARVDRLDEEKEALEAARVDNLRKKLDVYIIKDLAEESAGHGAVKTVVLAEPKVEPKVPTPVQAAEAVTKIEVPTEAPTAVSQPAIQVVPEPAVIKQEPAAISAVPVPAQAPVEIKPAAVEEAPVVKQALELPVAVITAKPVKGYSPLKVNFSGQKSFSKSGKIVSYLWDFGDGDISTQKNPENTYWSTTFGSRSFTVTLTVRDQAGSVSSATSIIEVITR